MRPNQHNTGLTLLEVLFAITILGALAIMGFLSFLPLRGDADVTAVSNQIIATLQLARNRTLASVNDTQYGVHFESNQFTLFVGNSYNSAALDNETHDLPSGIEISSINLIGGGSDVIFERVDGTTDQSGTLDVVLTRDTTNTNTISILPSGLVGFEGTVTPVDSRVTDTRHLHFDLGYSIQGATTLTLTFSDPPNPDVVEIVNAPNYFNGSQTEFDWQNTINVNGSDQTIRIHTHTLTASDTILSIHRDGRYNDKAVTIEFDGQEIVSYSADGTATVGQFGGTMQEQ